MIARKLSIIGHIGSITLNTYGGKNPSKHLSGREDSLTVWFYVGYFFSSPDSENCQEK
ncbi:hypothetical protein C789_5059 [Microcystis aeruginosa FACHB-905 = DIANCHI905]|uniref:Uncharacterized protein n=1 Tax=Microcystis aeruginosa PCC 7806SL TaxID=1903187 RepID=A0AB33C525_MICA7|nr:hypothetical protein BH695_5140 [Microcystis aeruginosa PCC 7806SL]ELS45131.1 hypothetical protein C789_5059 [Microcystis aeruginosa FACHB-905 = DIANCHI905]